MSSGPLVYQHTNYMRYTAAKILIVVFCSIFMVIGALPLASSLFVEFDLFFLLWGGAFFFIPLLIMVSRLRELSRFSTMTYDWYKASHPKGVEGGRLSCFACGSPLIRVRALVNRTFHREHFCAQCGKTLYYSPEQN